MQDKTVDDQRREMLAELIVAYRRRLLAGDDFTDQELIQQHPELMPELADELKKVRRIEAAKLRTEDETVPHSATSPAVASCPPPQDAQRKTPDETLSHRPVSEDTPSQHSRLPIVGKGEGHFGDYELLEEMARGGMGVVYKARQVSLNRIVALKMILAGNLASDQDVQRFHAEAEAAAHLDHPHIVPIYEVGEQDGQHYFSMGYVDGEGLNAIIRDNPLTSKKAAKYMEAVAAAIDYAHQKGVLHRDIKPSNVLVDKNDQPKVTDFGLAKRTDSDSNLTATGQVLGTPSYMPPEQAFGDHAQVDATSDVYSLGALLYALLTGRPPFQAETTAATLMQVVNQEPVSPRLLNPAIDPDLETICLKCLEKEQLRRYQAARDLGDELGRYLRGEPIVARPLSRAARAWRWCRRNPLVASLTGVALLLLCLVAGVATVGYVQTSTALKGEREQRERAEEQERLASAALEREKSARSEAQKERKAADAASREAQRVLVDMQTSRGRDAAADGDHGSALLWFAEAAHQSTLDPGRRAANLIRARNAVRDAPVPVAWVPVEHGVSRLRFLMHGRFLMIRGPRRMTVKDLQSHEDPHHLELACSAVGVSPNQVTLAVANGASPVRWYTLPATNPSRTLEVDGQVTAVACSHSDRYWAFAVGGRIRVWDNATGAWSEGVFDTGDQIYELKFSPDGRRLAVAGRQDQAWVLRFEKERLHGTPALGPVKHLYTKQRQGARVTGPVFVDRGRALVCIESWKSLSRYALGAEPRGQSRSIPVNNIYRSTWLLESPDARGFAVIAHHFMQFHDGNGKERKRVRPHRLQILDASLSQEGKLLFTASWDTTAQLQDFVTGATIGSSFPHESQVRRCAISSDGQLLATAQGQKHIRVWRRKGFLAPVADVPLWGMVPRLSPDGSLVSPGTWHLDSSRIERTLQSLRRVQILDTENGRKVGTPIELDGHYVDTRVAADAQTVAVAWQAGDTNNPTASFGLFDIATGTPRTPAIELPGDPRSVAAHPQDPQVAVLYAGGVLALDATTAHPLWRREDIPHPWPSHTARYTPDGSALVAAEADFIHVMRASDGEPLCRPIPSQPEDSKIRTFAISPDSRHLAVATLDGAGSYLQVWDMADGEPVSEQIVVPGPWTAVNVLAFSPDGAVLAVGGGGKEIRCLNWRDGTLHCPPLRHETGISGIAFSPEGRLISAHGGALRFWDLQTGKPLARSLRADNDWPWVTAVASTPDGRRLVCSHARELRAWVLNADELLGAPTMSADTYRLLAECATGFRIALGERSLLSAQEWQQRYLKVRADWQWEPHVSDPNYWAKKVSASPWPRNHLTVARRAARHEGMLERLLELRPDSAGVHLAMAERCLSEGDGAAADEHVRLAAALLVSQLRFVLNILPEAQAVASVLRDWEFPNDLLHFRETWPLIKQVDLPMYKACLDRRKRSAERMADAGDVDGARKRYLELLEVEPDDPVLRNRLKKLPPEQP